MTTRLKCQEKQSDIIKVSWTVRHEIFMELPQNGIELFYNHDERKQRQTDAPSKESIVLIEEGRKLALTKNV